MKGNFLVDTMKSYYADYGNRLATKMDDVLGTLINGTRGSD